MRSLTVLTATALLVVTSPACASDATPAAKPQEGKQRWSYALGAMTAQNFDQGGADIDIDMFIAGLKASLAGQNALSEEEMQASFNEFRTTMQAAQQKKQAEEAEKNKTAGQAFLTENGAREGVTTTPSGLQYEVITAGNGPTPTSTDTVSVHYRGTLLDGTQFDSSYDRGQPATFGVTQVIAGWTEALQLMPVGSKWKVYLPSDIAYGERGAPPKIGPGAVLIFEVELLGIQGPAAN